MTEGVSLHCRRSGGDGPALVLLHGLYGSGSNWARVAPAMAGTYRVLMPDLRNHGQSPTHSRMDYPAMAADIRALLDAEGLSEAIVLGHSMGGKVAMQLALAEPERVQALIIADMAPRAYDGAEHAGIIRALQALPLETLDSRSAADAALADDIPSAGIRQFLLTNLQRRNGGWAWRLPLEVLADQLPEIMGWPGVEGRYSDPALFIHGGRSPYLQDSDHAPILELFPQARFRCLEDCGHWLHVEDPEGFLQEVKAFLEKL